MPIIIQKGDITQIYCDAIVNPANSFGLMGGGVAGAIKRAGGPGIEKEAVNKSPIPVGSAVVTTAGLLSCRCVIHAPTMDRPAMKIGVENVTKATIAALELGVQLKAKSIAIPGMGTGVGGVAVADAAEAMVGVAKTFENSFERIIFVDRNDDMIQAFTRALHKKE